MRTSYGVSRYQASEGDALCRNRGPIDSSYGCLVFGGRSSTAAGNLAYSAGNQCMQAVAELGVPTLTADWSSATHWGNDTAVARVETARAYQATAEGITGSKVVCLGISMGSILALRYAMAHPTRVAALALILPVPDVQAMYDEDVGGFQAEIGTAYGDRPSDEQNPASNTDSFVGLPMRMWYATDDPVASPAAAAAFAVATGAELTSLGAVGHSLDSISTGDVAAFLREHA